MVTDNRPLIQPRAYQRGNDSVSLHPLNEPPVAEQTERPPAYGMNPTFLHLANVLDKNSSFGPNAVSVQQPIGNSNFLFASSPAADGVARSNIRLVDNANKPLPRMSLSNGTEPMDVCPPELPPNVLEKKKMKQQREDRLKKKGVKEEYVTEGVGDKDLDEILRELEPERADSLKPADKKKKKKSGARKHKQSRPDENDEIEVEVELDQDDANTTPPAAEIPPADSQVTVEVVSEKKPEEVPEESIQEEKPSEEKVEVKQPKVKPPVESPKPAAEDHRSPPLVQPLVDPIQAVVFTEEDLPLIDILHGRWVAFQQQYGDRIKHHDDRVTPKRTASRAVPEARTSSNGPPRRYEWVNSSKKKGARR